MRFRTKSVSYVNNLKALKPRPFQWETRLLDAQQDQSFWFLLSWSCRGHLPCMLSPSWKECEWRACTCLPVTHLSVSVALWPDGWSPTPPRSLVRETQQVTENLKEVLLVWALWCYVIYLNRLSWSCAAGSLTVAWVGFSELFSEIACVQDLVSGRIYLFCLFVCLFSQKHCAVATALDNHT